MLLLGNKNVPPTMMIVQRRYLYCCLQLCAGQVSAAVNISMHQIFPLPETETIILVDTMSVFKSGQTALHTMPVLSAIMINTYMIHDIMTEPYFYKNMDLRTEPLIHAMATLPLVISLHSTGLIFR